MANNRTEAKTAVTTALAPTLTLTQHIALLNDEINESTVFRKDVIDSETEVAGSVTIDYSNKDTATVTTAVNLAVSFTNLENGDVKYLAITKNATNTISFAGATDVSLRKNHINTVVTVVQYEVRNKNGVVTVDSINIANDNGAWQTPSYTSGYSDYNALGYKGLRYRLLTNGFLQLFGAVQRISAGSFTVFTLPAGFRPNHNANVLNDDTQAASAASFPITTIQSDGQVLDAFIILDGIRYYNTIIPLDS